MSSVQHDDDKVLESLQKAVSEALERKRRLGQYAVVWRDGKPTRIEPGTPAWHEGVLAARRTSIAEGKASYVSLDELKPDPDR